MNSYTLSRWSSRFCPNAFNQGRRAFASNSAPFSSVLGRFSSKKLRSAIPNFRSSSSSSSSNGGSLFDTAIFSSSLAVFCSVAFVDALADAPPQPSALMSSHVFMWGAVPGESDDSKAMLEPTLVKGLETIAAVKVVSSGENVAVITKDGELFTFGRGNSGVLGHDEDASASEPRLVEALIGKQVKDVSCSDFHMVVVTTDGVVYGWGRNWMGQLGFSDDRNDNVLLPTKIDSLGGVSAKSVSCGRNHTLVLSGDGRVFAFGSNSDGQLGTGDKSDHSVPAVVEGLQGVNIVQVAAGRGCSFFLSESGEVYSCGRDVYGELGHGKPGIVLSPRKISAFRHLKVKKISCSDFHAAAVTEDGEVYTWGFGKDGQNGLGNTNNVPKPTQVTSLQGHRAVDIACGQGHTAAITDGGQLYMWGRGRSGQLGRGDQLESVAAYRTEAVPVPFFSHETETTVSAAVQSVALGNNHSVAVSCSHDSCL